MAVPANTATTFTTEALREDLAPILSIISPTDTPFCTMARRGKAKAVTHEWITDELKPANGDNKRLQGDDSTREAATTGRRLTNETQIMAKEPSVSGTMEAVDSVGGHNKLAYQRMLRIKELKRDMEARATSASPKVKAAPNVEGELAGFETWVTNSSRGTGGADPAGDGSDAPTAGTNRPFTEALLKEVSEKVWQEGGNPQLLMVNGRQKQAVSGFAGIATTTTNVTATRENTNVHILGAADVYQGDFHTLKVVPNRFMSPNSAHLVEQDKWRMAYLRPVKNKPLAKTGDSDVELINAEFTLVSVHPEANGIVADLQ